MIAKLLMQIRLMQLLAFVCLVILTGANSARADDEVHVYMFRGMLNIFSVGLDEIADDLRARGVKVTVLSHLSSSQAYREILAGGTSRQPGTRPLILVGHSLGANTVLSLSKSLAEKNIKVNLAMTLDPTAGGPLSSNVRRYINYHFGSAGLRGHSGTPAATQKLVKNINLRRHGAMGSDSTSHFVMTSNETLQREIIQTILRNLR